MRMPEPLPKFRFHTDPPAPTAILPSPLRCAACGETRGYSVNKNYGINSYDCICPWCIADGTAAKKLDACFVQDTDQPVSPALWDELNLRNPGYISWQGENWLVHCDMPCVFHGDLPAGEVKLLPAEAEAKFLEENTWLEDWEDVKESYANEQSHVALYKFVCGTCGLWRIGIDFT